MNPTTSTRSYYPALDGLRGVAILLVICCHNFNFIPWLESGWIGVDLFFVLSGFLITDILLATKGQKNFLQNFYIRRIIRIFPLYYGALLVFFLVAQLLQNLQPQYDYYHHHQVMAWLNLQNWLYIFNQKPNDFLLLNHFWSLSLEEQFYLVWPLIILMSKNSRRLGQVVCLILGVVIISRLSSWLYWGNGYTNFSFQYMTRLDGLCVGSLVAIWRFNSPEKAGRKITYLTLTLLGAHLIAFILSRTTFSNFPHFSFFGYSSIASVMGLSVFILVRKRNMFSRILLENALLKYIGKISYGLYVYHWPILILAKLYFLDKLLGSGFNYISAITITSVGAFAVALLTAIASYHLFESKMLLLKDVLTEEGYFKKIREKISMWFNPFPNH